MLISTIPFQEARIKVATQADVLSRGFEHLLAQNRKVDNRSQSLESERRRSLGARPKETEKNGPKRERSLQDIDKDIETIWKELQQLDTSSETTDERLASNIDKT